MTNAKFLGFVAASLGSFATQGQSHEHIACNRLLNAASVHAAKREPQAALAAYDGALPCAPWALWQFIEASATALHFGDTTKAMDHVVELHRRGGAPLITYPPEIKGVFATGIGTSLRTRLDLADHNWSERADSTWIKALIEMKELDQSDRSTEVVYLRNDSVNLERMLTMTLERGFPTTARVGASYGIVDLLLWHHRGEIGHSPSFERYIGLVQNAMDAGEVEPDFLCGLRDYDDHEAGRPLRYGTLLNYFSGAGHVELVERNELNRNRASVGLPPIEDFAIVMNLDLDRLTAPHTPMPGK